MNAADKWIVGVESAKDRYVVGVKSMCPKYARAMQRQAKHRQRLRKLVLSMPNDTAEQRQQRALVWQNGMKSKPWLTIEQRHGIRKS